MNKNTLVVELAHGQSAIPRIEQYAEHIREFCNKADNAAKRPCKFRFEKVSTEAYRDTGEFRVSYHCDACNYSKVIMLEVQFTDELWRG